MADNKGSLPADLIAGACTAAAPCALTNDAAATTYDTGYTIYQSANNRITVAAHGAELSASISVTR